MTNPRQALEQLLAALDQLEIAYAIGGSTASSVHGEPRTTFDIDVIARIDEGKVRDLVELTADAFYSDEPTAREAISLGRSFHLIHLLTAFKFDLFQGSHDQPARRRVGMHHHIRGGLLDRRSSGTICWALCAERGPRWIART